MVEGKDVNDEKEPTAGPQPKSRTEDGLK